MAELKGSTVEASLIFRRAAVRPMLDQAHRLLVQNGLRQSGQRIGPDIEAAIIALGLTIQNAEDGSEAAARFLELCVAIMAKTPGEDRLLSAHLGRANSIGAFFRVTQQTATEVQNRSVESAKNLPFDAEPSGEAEQTSDLEPAVQNAPDALRRFFRSQLEASRAERSSLVVLLTGALNWFSRFFRWRRQYARLVRQRLSEAALRLSLVTERATPIDQDVALDRASAVAWPRREPGETYRLDIERTIEATIASAGLFSPRWKRNWRSIEYLFLVHGLGLRDLEQHRLDQTLDRLVAAGIPLARYYFRADPRRLRELSHGPTDEERAVDLSTLIDRYPMSRLIIISTGRELIHPFTFRPAAWTAALAAWPRRALLTPIPRASWSRLEAILRDELGFAIGSSRPAAFADVSRLLSASTPEYSPVAPLGPLPPDILQSNELAFVSDLAPPEEEQSTLMAQLRSYLGDEGFQLLAACSFYPEPRLDLAEYLQGALTGAGSMRSAERDDLLARLASLCWFRQGYLPTWFRRRVRASLPRRQWITLRKRLVEVFGEAFALDVTPSNEAGGRTGRVSLPVYYMKSGATSPQVDVDGVTLEFVLDGPTRDIDPLLKVPVLPRALPPSSVPDRPVSDAAPAPVLEAATAGSTGEIVKEESPTTTPIGESTSIQGWGDHRAGMIFLNHSGRDNFEAVAVRDWLVAEGWNEVFLDIDPERGIAAGERWERALHAATMRCEAVIFLISSNWLASSWSLREYSLARGLNKKLFAAIIEPGMKIADLPPELLDTWQAVDLVGGHDTQILRVVLPGSHEVKHVAFSKEGLRRLKRGLERAGLDPNSFAWPPPGEPDRAPYRGLKPFETVDAGIFFGREAPIIEATDRLRGLHAAAPPRLLALFGASGAGKSSFLRAGLLPRLTRDDSHFLPLPVIRPERAALFGESGLLSALEMALPTRDRRDIRAAIQAGAAGVRPLLTELADTSFKRTLAAEETTKPPTIVISIDQAEELFRAEGAAESGALLDLIRDLTIDDRPAVIAIFVVRSDSYDALQSAKPLESLRSTLPLLPLPRGACKDVIEGPARRRVEAGGKLVIEPRLIAQLLADIEQGGGSNALPLLAFTLEQLYLDHGAAGVLRLSDYQAFGGLRGAIDAAVERALRRADQDQRIPRDRHTRELLLRRGLIPWLAGIDLETKSPRCNRARKSDIPEEARPLIDLLVEERLLVTDVAIETSAMGAGIHVATIEPAHEALLRQWDLLQGWLAEDFALLVTLEGIKRAARDWEANSRSDAWLAHQGQRLAEGQALDARPDIAARLDPTDRAYLADCRAKEEATRSEWEALRRAREELQREREEFEKRRLRWPWSRRSN